MATRYKPKDRVTIVKGWFSDVQFWQGVAASTISAGLLAAGALLTALLTGLADVKTVVFGFFSFGLVFGIAWLGLYFLPTMRDTQKLMALTVALMQSEESGVRLGQSDDESRLPPLGPVIAVLISLLGLVLTAIFLPHDWVLIPLSGHR